MYKYLLQNHTRMRKLTIWAITVNQLLIMAHFPVAWAMTWFQNGLAKIRIIETTRAVDGDGLDHRQANEQGSW